MSYQRDAMEIVMSNMLSNNQRTIAIERVRMRMADANAMLRGTLSIPTRVGRLDYYRALRMQLLEVVKFLDDLINDSTMAAVIPDGERIRPLDIDEGPFITGGTKEPGNG